LLGHRPTGAVSGNVIRILPPSFLPARRPTGRSPFWKRRFQNRRYQRNRLDAVIKLGGRCLDVRTGPANLQPKVRSLNRRVADFMSNPQFLRPRAPTSSVPLFHYRAEMEHSFVPQRPLICVTEPLRCFSGLGLSHVLRTKHHLIPVRVPDAPTVRAAGSPDNVPILHCAVCTGSS